MAHKRKAVTKKARFEVFKRDSFTCQYCGQSAPDTVLEIDHIKPVSKGGDNEIINLITSCRGCNSGKSDRELDDNAAIQKQKAMLDELNERREQLEMLLQWREGLKDIGEQQVDAICSAWEGAVDGYHLSEHGEKDAKRLLRKYGLNTVLEAIEIASEKYLKTDPDGDLVRESVNEAWHKVGGICYYLSQPSDEREIAYIRGIVRNRMYCNETYCLQLLKDAHRAGIELGELKDLAVTARNWSEWQLAMHDLIEARGKENG